MSTDAPLGDPGDPTAADDEAVQGLSSAGVVGVITSIRSGAIEVNTKEGVVTVVPEPGARMYSGASGEVMDTNQFLLRDRIAAEGRWEKPGVQFRAHSIGSLFDTIEVNVEAVDAAGSVRTDKGIVRLDIGRLPFSRRTPNSPALAEGHVLRGLAWKHPATEEYYLLKAGHE